MSESGWAKRELERLPNRKPRKPQLPPWDEALLESEKNNWYGKGWNHYVDRLPFNKLVLPPWDYYYRMGYEDARSEDE